MKIGDVLVEFKLSPVENHEYEILTLTEKNGFVRQIDRFKKRLATEDISKYKVVERNTIAFNPYLLWAGALALNDNFDDGIVSPLYPTFRVKEDVDAEYLFAILLSPQMIQQFDQISYGSVPRKRRSSVKDFLNLQLPGLPPLGEQKRIAEILGEVSKAVELVSRQLEILDHGLKTKMWNDADESSHVSLDHYIQKITSGKSLKEGDSEDYQNSVLKISAVTTGYFNEMEVKPLPKSYDPPESHRANNGDILLSRANTTELVGASALVETSATNLFLPDKLWKLQLKDQVNVYFFWHLLQTKLVRSSISKASSGSGGSMKNISQKAFLAISVPEFSNEVQNQIGNIVREQRALRHLLHRKLSLLQELQKSLANRAFAGLL
jgi:type I restriction enzyme stySJI specificity protein